MQFNVITGFYFLAISDEQLVLTCVDFSFPALSAVPATIAFLFQQMLLCPEIQQKIQNEIDQVVGHGRAPTLSDRVKWVLLFWLNLRFLSQIFALF